MTQPPLLSVVGLLAQSGVAVLIAVVSGGRLRRYGRRYRRHWTYSWSGLAVHAGAGGIAILLSQWLPVTHPTRFALALVAGIAGYLQIAWLVLGTGELTSGRALRPRTSRLLLTGLTLLGAALVVAYGWDASRSDLLFTLRLTVRRRTVALSFDGGARGRSAPARATRCARSAFSISTASRS